MNVCPSAGEQVFVAWTTLGVSLMVILLLGELMESVLCSARPVKATSSSSSSSSSSCPGRRLPPPPEFVLEAPLVSLTCWNIFWRSSCGAMYTLAERRKAKIKSSSGKCTSDGTKCSTRASQVPLVRKPFPLKTRFCQFKKNAHIITTSFFCILRRNFFPQNSTQQRKKVQEWNTLTNKEHIFFPNKKITTRHHHSSQLNTFFSFWKWWWWYAQNERKKHAWRSHYIVFEEKSDTAC